IVPLLEQLMERAHAEGTLRPDAGFHDFPIIMAMVTEMAQHSEGCRPGLYERYLELVIDGLRARPDNGPIGAAPTETDVRGVMRGCVPPMRSSRS
ncbi:TetR/AcrR family transcriptional regulator, partial [Actinoplanes philippinensis]